ncbi:MAG: phosphoribosyl-AMP cyclohydrolase [Balneolaceae bacterium]|nr:MAG: phosphoribosyl-AMP cyclohydrolase [Balneolaceae bacterium]
MAKSSINAVEETEKLNLQFDKRGGLLPVVVQEASTKEILMVASVNQKALNHSLETGEATFWSTSRNELWIKGVTSGNKIYLKEIRVDCDQDAIIYLVTLDGDGVCHTKSRKQTHRKSCFYRKLIPGNKKLIFIEP